MSKVGIGVIGCGAMGMGMVRRILELADGLEIRGLFDPDPRSIEKALEALPNDPTVYDDYHALVASGEIDWVMIASWNCFHAEQTVAAFEAGKHVFCQKPLATTLEECAQMHRAWKASGKMFNIGLTLRYSPHYRKIRQLIEEGILGRMLSMEFNETIDFNHGGYIMGDWRRLRKYAGTHLLEKCCHDIDLANWMVGADAARVASFGGLDFFLPENEHHVERLGTNDRGRKAYSTWGGLIDENPFTSDKDIIDNQVAIIEYANGVRACFHANCNAGITERRMYILGTEGAIRANVLTGAIETRRIGFGTVIEDAATDASGGHGGGDMVLAGELADSMLRESPPSVGLIEGLKSSVTCFAIDDALDTGKVVDVAPYWKEVGLGE